MDHPSKPALSSFDETAETIQLAMFDHHDELVRFAASRLPKELAKLGIAPEDIVQETYFRALRQAKGFRPEELNSPRAWLFTVLRRCIIDMIRGARAVRRGPGMAAAVGGSSSDSVVAALEQLAVDRHTPSKSAAAREFWTVVEQAIKRLSPDHATVLRLRYLRGLSTRETADDMGRTIGAIELLSIRALRELRTQFRPSGTGLVPRK